MSKDNQTLPSACTRQFDLMEHIREWAVPGNLAAADTNDETEERYDTSDD
jgi:hypothetical protein